MSQICLVKAPALPYYDGTKEIEVTHAKPSAMVQQGCSMIAGYGDVAPTTRTERIIAMVIMAVG